MDNSFVDSWCDPVERGSLRSRNRRSNSEAVAPQEPDQEAEGMPWGLAGLFALGLLMAFVYASVWSHQPPTEMMEWKLHALAPLRPPVSLNQMVYTRSNPDYSYGAGEYRFSCLHRGPKVAVKESPLSPPLAVPAMPGSGPLLRIPACPGAAAYARVVYYRPGDAWDFLRAGILMSNRKGTWFAPAPRHLALGSIRSRAAQIDPLESPQQTGLPHYLYSGTGPYANGHYAYTCVYADGTESGMSPSIRTDDPHYEDPVHRNRHGLVLYYPACVLSTMFNATVVRQRNVWFRSTQNDMFEQAGVIRNNKDHFSFAAGPNWFEFEAEGKGN